MYCHDRMFILFYIQLSDRDPWSILETFCPNLPCWPIESCLFTFKWAVLYTWLHYWLWRGGRGKAERARGRAGSETSGESVGKWIMINTCIWFQWLPGRLEKAPAGLQWGGSSEHAKEREHCWRRRREPPEKKSARTLFTFCCYCFILCY